MKKKAHGAILLVAFALLTSIQGHAEIAPRWPTLQSADQMLPDDHLAQVIARRPQFEQLAQASNYRGAGNRDALSSAMSLCADCEIQLGIGGTYHSFGATGGTVLPMTVSWDRSRWEFGVFHFSEQSSSDNEENAERVVARPYWGASLSRRYPLFERGPLRAIFGFGVSYRTEQDVLSATHWNFSSQLGLRFQPPRFPAIFELSARHWSNGGVRTPNRGQDFTILTVRFDR